MYKKKPDWLKIKLNTNKDSKSLKSMISDLNLHTVCKEANCPNLMECFSKKTATFMILGNVCSRNCTFCNVKNGKPLPIDPDEPANVAKVVEKMGLQYVVVTSVTRDDLPDGGSHQFVRVIEEIKKISSEIKVEVLIPDFQGDEEALLTVVKAKPEVINHNIETIERLYPELRPQADYHRTLRLLKRIKALDNEIFSKSGFMVGLNETEEEVEKLLSDLREHGCDIVTIGQYLSPSKEHYPVKEYVHPDTFEKFKKMGYEMGFKSVVSGPLVRSSYKAAEALSG